MRVVLSILACVVLAAGCNEVSTTRKLEQAEQLLRTRVGDAFARAEALGLYRDVYAATTSGSTEHVRAAFGIGMIGVADLLHSAARLVSDSTDTTTETEPDSSAPPLPPGEDLVPILSTLVDVVLDEGIIQPWREVITQDDFSFTFDEGSFVLPGIVTDTTPVDLSGEWDLTEIRLIYGLLQEAVTAVKFVAAYDGVVATVVDAALTDATIPDLPDSPAQIPAWILDASDALGFDTPPWLDAEFGVLLADSTALAALRARASDGLAAIENGLDYLANEDDEQDDDVFPQGKFIRQILVRVAGVPDNDIVVLAIDPLLSTSRLQELARLARQSLDNDATVFLAPDWVWTDLLETALSTAVGDYPGPKRPDGLRIPAINLSTLFTAPVTDLKDRDTGLLPFYCIESEVGTVAGCDRAGAFVTRSEQEPWTDANGNDAVDDGEFEDTGVDGLPDANGDLVADSSGRPGVGNGKWDEPVALRSGDPFVALEKLDSTAVASLPPLAQQHPLGSTEPANGIVDPVYLFMPNPNLNGLLQPVTSTAPGEYAVATTGVYSNPDLNRLLSSLIWIIDSAN
ncbi:MAG: hypothetical protein D6761_01430 [Candidatus Dadabacteria bacterium]|nr:MAG: hypothetical protein D6761_01430 [Candidatus Dadabacteria bacterium]